MFNCFGNQFKTSGIMFVDELSNLTHSNDIDLYYLISGKLEVNINEEKFTLEENDIVLLNFEDRLAIINNFENNLLVVKLTLTNELFYENIGIFQPTFLCNNLKYRDKDSYKLLRKSIDNLIMCVISNEQEKYFNLLSSSFLVLNNLMNLFYRDSPKVDSDNQFINIIHFIHKNANGDLKLTDVSEHFYMNSSYFSRYFKEKQGVGFQKYLTNYRLKNSETDLIYTDKKINEIAIDSGYANSKQFVQNFVKNYQMTPNEFRQKNKVIIKEDEELNNQKIKILEKWILNTDQDTNVIRKIKIDCYEKKYSLPEQLINVGSATDLLHSDYRKHIIFLKKELNFSYGRIWNIFVEEMNVDINRIKDINFDRIDSILDFLLEANIIPFIELSYKIRRIYKSVRMAETPILSKPSYDIGTNDWKELLEAFIKHVQKRYGYEEVSRWKFELTRDEKDIEEYGKQYYDTYETIKRINQQTKVGGAGFKLKFDQINLKDELSYYKKKNLKFDFLSFMIYPYERINNSQRSSKRISNPDFLKIALQEAKTTIKESNFSELPLYITEWGNTISNRNKINDSLYKGAYSIRNFIDIFDEVDLIGYWLATDLYSNFVDSKAILSGGSGALNKNGIPKPFFFAIKFLMNMSSSIIYRDEDCLIAVVSESKFQIILHNEKRLNYRYFLLSENEINFSDISKLFVNDERKNLQIDLLNLNSSIWKIKTYTVNNIAGNLLNNWKNIDYRPELKRDEIDYLNRITLPKLSFSKGGEQVVKIESELEANGFCLIEVYRD